LPSKQAVPIDLIDLDPLLVRGDPGEDQHIKEIMASLHNKQGLARPILLRPTGDRFVLVHGNRRFLAAKLLGWKSIWAVMRDIPAAVAYWIWMDENLISRFSEQPTQLPIDYPIPEEDRGPIINAAYGVPLSRPQLLVLGGPLLVILLGALSTMLLSNNGRSQNVTAVNADLRLVFILSKFKNSLLIPYQ